ncbi:hypothetical protein N7486_002954 [Penicillium sp. IBT 16267x]|nr:hypothetical protein N7486_002954 [Penicillium sp. IBT 16267x]
MAYQSDPGGPHMWVHIRFNYARDKDKTERDLLEHARDEVLHGTTWESPTHEVEMEYRLITCDKMLEKWSQELDRGLGLPFDQGKLFKAPGKWNHAAVGIVWDEVDRQYHPHIFYGRTVVFRDAIGVSRRVEGESRRRHRH